MGDFIALLNASPEDMKRVALAITYIVAIVILAEKILGLFSKTSSERRARRKEDLEDLSNLIGDDEALKALCVESNQQEAFKRLTHLNVSRERRNLVLEILAMGFLPTKAARLLEPLLSVTAEGKYIVAIAIADLLLAFIGVIGLCYVGAVMLAFNLAIGESQTLARMIILLIGGGGLWFIAYMTLDPIRSIVLAHGTAKRLKEKGLLEGKPGWWSQTIQGVKENKVFTCIFMVYLVAVVVFGSFWGQTLKG